MVTPRRFVNKVAPHPVNTADAAEGDGNDIARLRNAVLAAVASTLESPEAEALLRQLGGAKGRLDEREQSLLSLRKLVGRAMAQVCLEQERGYSGARQVCRCGRTARYVRDDSKRYVTLVGEVELQRAEYRCPACGSWRPLDEQWGLPKGHFTPGVVQLASSIGGALPFERAAEVLRELSGIGMSASQVRRLSEQVGAEIGRQREQEREWILSGEMVAFAPPAVLVLAIDGAHVNTRAGGWKETKVGMAARCEWREREGQSTLRATAVEYTAQVGPPEPLGRSLYAVGQRMGGRGRECTIALGDGAPWIWNQVAEHFPHAVQVLDFYHLAEHVHETARTLFVGNETQAKDWSETVLTLLRAQETETALEYLRRSGAATADLVKYITDNQNRVPYRWLEERGYPIGSGMVESACKQIVHTRHRQAGMRWDKEHVQKMLNLACCLRSKRWEEFWASKPRVA